MKSQVSHILIVITLVLSVIVLFFRDRFLFYITGYDNSLIHSTSVESFKAHAAIHIWRFVLIGITFFSGIICIVTCRNMEKKTDEWIYVIGKFLGIITCVVMGIILFMYLILPKKLF